MNQALLAALGGLALAATLSTPAQARDVDIGVSIGISQPGIYGRIDIGRYPQPQVIVAQPVIVAPPRHVIVREVEPVYMWVPPGHRKNWRKHCREYGACGAPVVFVRDDWYDRHVHHGRGHDDHGKHRGKGKHRDD